MISEKKIEELKNRMTSLKIFDADLEEKFIKGSGKGGQKLQKTSSCVYLKHLPTKTEVKCQKGRSREENRFFARRLLCDAIEKNVFQKKTTKEIKQEKIKKQKNRRERKQKKLTEEL